MLNQVNLGSYLLDQFTLKDIMLSVQRHDAIIAYFWEHYSYFTNRSVLNMPGGRFNIGNIDEIKYPTFAALYLAENKEIENRTTKRRRI